MMKLIVAFSNFANAPNKWENIAVRVNILNFEIFIGPITVHNLHSVAGRLMETVITVE
jgi:hypothetical protein